MCIRDRSIYFRMFSACKVKYRKCYASIINQIRYKNISHGIAYDIWKSRRGGRILITLWPLKTHALITQKLHGQHLSKTKMYTYTRRNVESLNVWSRLWCHTHPLAIPFFNETYFYYYFLFTFFFFFVNQI